MRDLGATGEHAQRRVRGRHDVLDFDRVARRRGHSEDRDEYGPVPKSTSGGGTGFTRIPLDSAFHSASVWTTRYDRLWTPKRSAIRSPRRATRPRPADLAVRGVPGRLEGGTPGEGAIPVGPAMPWSTRVARMIATRAAGRAKRIALKGARDWHEDSANSNPKDGLAVRATFAGEARAFLFRC